MRLKRRLAKEIEELTFRDDAPDTIKCRAGIKAEKSSDVQSSVRRSPLRRRLWQVLPAVACACAVVILTVTLLIPRPLAFTPEPTVVTLQLNPAIEFKLDENAVVTAQRGLNKEGKIVLLGQNYVGADAAEACADIVQTSKRLGYLPNAEDPIRLTVVNKEREKEISDAAKIEQKTKTLLNETNIANPVKLNAVDEKDSKDAKKYGVSDAAVSLARNAAERRGMTLKEALMLPIDEILETVHAYDATEMAEYEARIEQYFDALEDARESENESAEQALDALEDLAEKIEELSERFADTAQEEIAALQARLWTVIDSADWLTGLADSPEKLAKRFTSEEELTRLASDLDEQIERREEILERIEDEYEDELDRLKERLLAEAEED